MEELKQITQEASTPVHGFICLHRILPDASTAALWLRADTIFGVQPLAAKLATAAGELSIPVTVVLASQEGMSFEAWVRETPDVVLTLIHRAHTN